MSEQKKKGKEIKISPFVKINDCPKKEGDNCKVPGVFNDSEPIGGA